jgi:ankyrin repeat protein
MLSLLGFCMLLSSCSFLENKAANAVAENKIFRLKILLLLGVSANSVVEGDPLLNIATSNTIFGGVEVSKMLLEHGADPNKPGRMGTTPLMLAAQEGLESNVIMLLAHKADPKQKDDNGQTPFFHLGGHDDARASIFKNLVNFGGDPCQRDNNDRTAKQAIQDIDSNPKVRALFEEYCKQ